MTCERYFDVYGYRFVVRGPGRIVCEGIAEDFAFFSRELCTQPVEISLMEARPPFEQIPVSDAILYTPRNVVYADLENRYVDFHGKALGIHNRATGCYRVYSQDCGLLYEAAYLFLLSQIGSFQDRRGLHRVHALSMNIRGRSVLIMLPMGGGKSTLGLSLLEHPGVQILSDDSSFIDRGGRAHAFPLRLGLLPGGEDSVPLQHRRVIERMEFGPKIVVNYQYFANSVSNSAPPGLVLIGRRTTASECRVAEASFKDGLQACLSHCIVGLGLFQGVEFVLTRSGWEILGQAGIAWSRTRNCLSLLRKSHTAFLHLGRDPANNAASVIEYAERVLH